MSTTQTAKPAKPKPARGVLGITAANAVQSWEWAPSAHPDGRLGHVRIDLVSKTGLTKESDTYAVWALGPLAGLMGHEYRFTNLTDPGVTAETESYTVRTGPLASCGCKAGQVGRACKHRKAAVALAEKGLVPGGPAGAKAETGGEGA